MSTLHEQLREVMEGRMTFRALLAFAIMTPTLTMVVVSRAYTDELKVSRSVQILVGALPALMILVLAANLPDGLPHPAARPVALLQGLLAALMIPEVQARWHESAEEPLRMRLARTFVVCVNIPLMLRFAWKMWRREDEFWSCVRLNILVINGTRFVLVIFLLANGAAPHSYPPGTLMFSDAILFNLSCFSLGAFGLAPSCRQRMSQWFRRDLSLADFNSTWFAPKPAHEHDRMSQASWCTASEASTYGNGTDDASTMLYLNARQGAVAAFKRRLGWVSGE